MAKPKVNFNHYISRCYQRSWQLTDKVGWIGVYGKDGGYEPKAIKRNGALEHFYDDELETEFGPIETEFGKALVTIKAREPISATQQEAIVRFMTTQLRRNPVGWMRTEHTMQEVLKVQRPQNLREFRSQVFAEDGNDEEKRETWAALQARIHDAYDRLEAEGLTKAIFRKVTLRDEGVFKDMLRADLSWTFFTTEEPHRFVTSDNPVVLPKEGLEARPKLMFPISPLICLVARRPPTGEGRVIEYRPLGPKRVPKFNRKIIASAHEAVYTSGPNLRNEELNRLGTEIWGQRLTISPELVSF